MALIFILLTSLWVHASEIRPFESDGCTMSPDGTFRERTKWRDCCIAHDLRLWGGGTKEERVEADLTLRQCMETKAGPRIAKIFWLAVKMGSHSPIKLPNKQWGNAWYQNSGYRSLAPEEIDRLIIKIQELEINPQIKDDYILELQTRN